jgi:hypothetical protein
VDLHLSSQPCSLSRGPKRPHSHGPNAVPQCTHRDQSSILSIRSPDSPSVIRGLAYVMGQDVGLWDVGGRRGDQRREQDQTHHWMGQQPIHNAARLRNASGRISPRCISRACSRRRWIARSSSRPRSASRDDNARKDVRWMFFDAELCKRNTTERSSGRWQCFPCSHWCGLLLDRVQVHNFPAHAAVLKPGGMRQCGDRAGKEGRHVGRGEGESSRSRAIVS